MESGAKMSTIGAVSRTAGQQLAAGSLLPAVYPMCNWVPP